MATEVRFKHLNSQQVKENWMGIKPATQSSDSNLIKGNSKFIGFSYFSSGGGLLCLLDQKKRGKMGLDIPMLKGHSKPIQDFEFFPFNENYIATCSEDATIKVWELPDELTSSITECKLTLNGHQKKVNLLSFNQGSEGVLAASDYEYKIKIWDVLKGQEQLTLKGPTQYSQCLDWNPNGSVLGSSWKDKFLRMSDPRTQNFQQEFFGHEGGITIKFCWLRKERSIVSFGFSKNHEREYKLWDLGNTSQAVSTVKIDSASGVFCPHFDQDLQILYLVGKGEGNIRYYEYQNGSLINFNNDFKSNQPGKGYGFMPKYTLDSGKNEIMRVLKLTENSVETVSFICPRKAVQFQEDLFPPCFQAFSQSADQYFSGQNAEPQRQSMKPGEINTCFYKALAFNAAGSPSKEKQVLQKPAISSLQKEEETKKEEPKVQQINDEDEKTQKKGSLNNQFTFSQAISEKEEKPAQQQQQNFWKKNESPQRNDDNKAKAVEEPVKDKQETLKVQQIQQEQTQQQHNNQQTSTTSTINNSEIIELKQKIKEQEDIIKQQKEKINGQEEKLNNFEENIKLLKQELESKAAVINENIEKNKQLEQKLVESDNTINDLRSEVANIQSQKITTEPNTSSGDKELLNSKLQGIRQEVVKLMQAIENI